MGRRTLTGELIELGLAVASVLERRAVPPLVPQVVPVLAAVRANGVIRQACLSQRITAPLRVREDVAQALAQDG
eukprot:8176413-Lingulodinium_polyedra.AAC.1